MRTRILPYWPWFALAFVIFGIGIYFWIKNPVQVAAIGASDVEIEFLVTDAETGKGIPDAAIKIKVNDTWEVENKVGLSVLCANTVGLVDSPIGQGPVLAVSACFPDRPEPAFNLTTDESGRAKFFKSQTIWEDIVRIRSTRRYFSMRWGSLWVSAKGYAAIDNMRLTEAGYADDGYDDKSHRHHLQVKLVLSRNGKD